MMNKPKLNKHIALIGMMGSGKSVIAQALQASLEIPCHDCDDIIADRAQCSISDIFANEGEDKFRQREQEVLQELLNTNTQSIIATGGGIVLSSANRKLLKTYALCIWLQASPAQLLTRITQPHLIGQRPLLSNKHDPLIYLQNLLEERTPLYQEVAQYTIDTEQLTTTALTMQILDLYQAHSKN